MGKSVKNAIDFEVEIEEIDREIESLNTRVENLNAKRKKLVVQRKQLDVAIALECIEETGLSMEDVMELINLELTKRRCNSR